MSALCSSEPLVYDSHILDMTDILCVWCRSTPEGDALLPHLIGVFGGPGGIAPNVGPADWQHAHGSTPGPEQVRPGGSGHQLVAEDVAQNAQACCLPSLTCIRRPPTLMPQVRCLENPRFESLGHDNEWSCQNYVYPPPPPPPPPKEQ